jgi:regulatory protein
MVITAITQQKKNEEKVNLFLDTKFWCSVSKNQLLEFNIFKGKEIDIAEKVEIAKASSETKIVEKILKFQQLRPHSEQEVKENLIYRKGYSEEEITPILEKLKESGHIDDEKFAHWYAENRLNYGVHGEKKIRMELMKKGVNSKIITQALDRFSENPELQKEREERLNKYVEKIYPRIKGKNEWERQMKLKLKLKAKGF